jgi:putative RNA 2'-phosphotransferase
MSNKTKTQQDSQHAKNEKLSKYLSFKLRHNPGTLKMDAEGWVSLHDLATEITQGDMTKTRLEIEEVVATCPKQRFAIDRERDLIRANQGHSLAIVLNRAEQVPPQILFHGTSKRPMQTIGTEGLKKMQRHHVHLSTEFSTAQDVGARHGTPVVIRVDALGMHRDGFKFYKSANGVWLTDHVPTKYMSWEQ